MWQCKFRKNEVEKWDALSIPLHHCSTNGYPFDGCDPVLAASAGNFRQSKGTFTRVAFSNVLDGQALSLSGPLLSRRR